MQETKVWATSEDGSIEYISLTKDLLEPALKAMQQSFYIQENICVAFNMVNQPESFPEMDKLVLRAANDGVSIVARDRATGKVAGVAFSKIEEKDDTSDFYRNHINSCKYSASRDVTQWMLDLENIVNIFEHCKVNCVMEVMFLGIVSDFRRRGIAKKLFEVSIDVARSLKHDKNVRVAIDDKPLQPRNPPQGVTAYCKIEFVSLTAERLREAVDVLKKSFFPYENICTAVGLANKPEAIDELDPILINTANQGVSVIAIDKDSGKIAGAMLNKIQDKNTSSKSMYAKYIQMAKHQETKSIFEFLTEFEDIVDPFTPYNADCLMELVFLGVLGEFTKRGIGQKLCEVSIELATQLLKGNNVKTSLNTTQLPLEPRPQVVTSVFTTFITQKMARRLNFDILKEVNYEDMHHNGKSYASIIADDSKSFTVECKKLEL